MSVTRAAVIALERLEGRMLLAADFSGTDGDDLIYLRPEPASEQQGAWVLHIFLNADPAGAPTRVVELTTTSFEFDAGGGNDHITLEKHEGAPALKLSGGDGDDGFELLDVSVGNDVTVVGGDGVDSLTMSGSAADEQVEVRTTAYRAGLANVVPDGLEELHVSLGDGKDSVNVYTNPPFSQLFPRVPKLLMINAGAGDDSVHINGSVRVGDGADGVAVTIDLMGGNDRASFSQAAAVAGIRVNGGDGNDAFDYTPGVSASAEFEFHGGDGNDEMRLNGRFTSLFERRHVYLAGPGDDRLWVTGEGGNVSGAGENLFDIGQDRATLNRHRLDFADVEHETYMGGIASDEFFYAGDGPDVGLDGRGGNDRFVLSGGHIPKNMRMSYNGVDTVEFAAGDYTIPPGSCVCVSLSLAAVRGVVRGDATLRFAADHSALGLEIAPGGRVSLDGNLTVRNLLIHPGGTLDLGIKRLKFEVPVDDAERARAMIESSVAAARYSDAGLWKGAGLTSNLAAADPQGGIAVWLDTRLLESRHVTLHAAFTRNGDTNLDGKLTADDYFRIDSGFLRQPASPTYGDGDFNYDDRVDADDYFLIDSAFLGQQPRALASSTSTAVSAESTDVALRRLRTRPVERVFGVGRSIRRAPARR